MKIIRSWRGRHKAEMRVMLNRSSCHRTITVGDNVLCKRTRTGSLVQVIWPKPKAVFRGDVADADNYAVLRSMSKCPFQPASDVDWPDQLGHEYKENTARSANVERHYECSSRVRVISFVRAGQS